MCLPGITMGASGARQPAGIPATERYLKEKNYPLSVVN